MSSKISYKVILLAFFIGSIAGLAATYLINFVIGGQGSFDGGLAGVVGAFCATVVVVRSSVLGKSNG